MSEGRLIGCFGFWAALLFVAAGCGGGKTEAPMQTADLILFKGKIYTLDPATPDGTAVAVLGDRILKVGSDVEVLTLAGPATKRLDLKGRAVIPGLIDSHLHLSSIGRALEEPDLSGLTSSEAVVKKVADAVALAAPGAWIVGNGWDQNLWKIPDFPPAAILEIGRAHV